MYQSRSEAHILIVRLLLVFNAPNLLGAPKLEKGSQKSCEGASTRTTGRQALHFGDPFRKGKPSAVDPVDQYLSCPGHSFGIGGAVRENNHPTQHIQDIVTSFCSATSNVYASQVSSQKGPLEIGRF